MSKEPEIENEVDSEKCNKGQKDFYQFICDWIKNRADNEPIYSILSGRAGCGKTFVVKCIQKFIRDNNCKQGFLKLAAPTGAAAFLIKGTTLHALFDLPVHLSFHLELPALTGSRLQNLQETFENTEILIIDEMSMVGQYMLYQINERLKQAKPNKSTIAFAGVSIVLMGDFAQLPPVTDSPLYAAKDKTGKDKTKYQILGRKLYMDLFNKCYTLTESMRQIGEDQETFRDILDKVATGMFDGKTRETLKAKTVIMDSQRANDQFKDAVKLCAYNKDAKSFNIKKLKDLKNPVALISAENSTPQAKKALANKAGGLHNNTIICKDSKVMLLANLWKEQGLTNGANGFVRYIIYDENLRPPKLPTCVLVYFPQYTGPSFFPDDPTKEKLVPIVPVQRSWYEKTKEHQRIMLPLIPSYAISIHKSQGQTLDKIILNIGIKEFAPGLTYTALSRAKKLENIAFDPFPQVNRIEDIKNKYMFGIRLIEERRLRDKEKERQENEKDLGFRDIAEEIV